jgi:V8-like Glu-specific endopeptidase
MRLASLILLSVILFASCRPRVIPTAPTNTQNVIGTDERVSMTSERYPWSAIGRLRFTRFDGTPGHCTAFLVWRNIALSNAHCALDSSTLRPSKNHFLELGRMREKVLVTVKVTPTAQGVPEPRMQDYAIFLLDQPYGDMLGWFEVASTEQLAALTQDARPVANASAPKDLLLSGLTLAGYSGDWAGGLMAAAHQGCNIYAKHLRSTSLHDCDTGGGASGSPIFFLQEDPAPGALVLAIHAGHYDPDPKVYPDGTDQPGVAYSRDIANIATSLSYLRQALEREVRRQRARLPGPEPDLLTIIRTRGLARDAEDKDPALVPPHRVDLQP